MTISYDKNVDAPGVAKAKELGIRCFTDIGVIPSADVDIIIEVTGSKSMAEILRNTYGNECRIMDSETASLLTILVEKAEEMNSVVKQIERLSKLSVHQVEASGKMEKAMEELRKIISG